MPANGEQRENQKRLTVAKTAALKAGKLLFPGKNCEVYSKGWHDMVTEMDLELEQIIVDYISGFFPEDDFFGEERGGGNKPGAGLWIIDPIDGTDNFIRGIPYFTISIGYRNSAGELTVGVIYNPRQRELFWAARGMGACLNGKPIHVSSLQDPGSANTIAVPHPRLRKEAHYFFTLMQKIALQSWDLRNFGSAALHIAYVASGRMDAFLQLGLKIYDIAAGLVILKESGGQYSGFFEGENILETGNLLATNGLLHNWYTAQIRSCGRPE
jgi:myo-inositol-1(or 4)-monophosphatase